MSQELPSEVIGTFTTDYNIGAGVATIGTKHIVIGNEDQQTTE